MVGEAGPDVWRALASPWRRRLLDRLRTAPATTGELAAGLPELSRFAVMQHLAVLTETGPGAVRVHVVKVAVGPLTEEGAAGIAVHGDFLPYAAAIEQLAGR